ncbi:MAG: hypothetical protein H6741_01820 [Alphaproteobacteria bacterium]|nr:hypothetical protein [Alphaproteobacteria bacterium]MCB9791440.1 hypothetical protein [Alphaproteobacteria bacterium]
MSDDTTGRGRETTRPRQLFLELTEDIPDLQVRAAALMAYTTGQRMAELLTGHSLPERPADRAAPVHDLSDRAEAFSDGIVNRRG